MTMPPLTPDGQTDLQTDRQMEGQTDGQPNYIHVMPPAAGAWRQLD